MIELQGGIEESRNYVQMLQVVEEGIEQIRLVNIYDHKMERRRQVQ